MSSGCQRKHVPHDRKRHPTFLNEGRQDRWPLPHLSQSSSSHYRCRGQRPLLRKKGKRKMVPRKSTKSIAIGTVAGEIPSCNGCSFINPAPIYFLQGWCPGSFFCLFHKLLYVFRRLLEVPWSCPDILSFSFYSSTLALFRTSERNERELIVPRNSVCNFCFRSFVCSLSLSFLFDFFYRKSLLICCSWGKNLIPCPVASVSY